MSEEMRAAVFKAREANGWDSDRTIAAVIAERDDLRAAVCAFLRNYDSDCPDYWPDLDDLRRLTEETK